ncbi:MULTISPECIES: cobalamin biosynthesis protein [Nostoc]|uniref:Cobalamin biosynthesis protein n=1 Tax=Nostoc paludosum FACHB-159 TaxID=2692908 RepID=A0ABR8JYD7_9NOSO|nr:MULTISPECIES: cobalamin biosynthesis protein [Nostoc]MBD2676431.1 cobalamin biosynthesis protein [Nostoc sp. FACHB-857]MBD2732437.1 cobalamin biosynthesis protein [Nostoc paludosum FACHB-159]
MQQILWVGIGCKRGTSWQLIDLAIEKVFEENQLCQSAIAGIATINTKASEVGLVEFCNLRNLPLKTFSAEVLRCVWVPNPSTITNQEVGTPSVAEAAAIVAATQLNFLFTDSLSISAEQLRVKLLVSKQIFPLKGQSGAVTLAVAQTAFFD